MLDSLSDHPKFGDKNCTAYDTAAMYPEFDDYEGIKAAKRLCLGCPILKDCAEWAIAKNETFGIWGGMTPYERKIERRQRNYKARTSIEHGTPRGAKAHYRRGEKPCEACRIAHTEIVQKAKRR